MNVRMDVTNLYKHVKQNKESFFIPVYIKLGNKISSYPRGIYAYEGMPYLEFKKKLYILIRKYIYCPQKGLPDGKQINKGIKVINEEYNYSELNEISKLIEKEYNKLISGIAFFTPFP